jgi:hypothetical protein
MYEYSAHPNNGGDERPSDTITQPAKDIKKYFRNIMFK